MTHDAQPPREGDSATNLWRMLGVAHRAGTDPFSDLATHLADSSSLATLLAATFDEPNAPLGGFGDARSLLRGPVGIEILRAMKARAKRDLSVDQRDPARRRAALLAFGLVISAALTHHRTIETRAQRDELEELLLILCSAEEQLIASLASTALTVLAELGGDQGAPAALAS